MIRDIHYYFVASAVQACLCKLKLPESSIGSQYIVINVQRGHYHLLEVHVYQSSNTMNDMMYFSGDAADY